MNSESMEVDNAQLEKILRGIRIPPRPEILLQLDEEQNRDDPDINRICEIISQDVSLAAAVLKTINSPFFGLSRKIDSVKRAVFLLGLKNVANLIKSAVLRNVFNGDGVSLERFWETATDTANISMYLSNRFAFEDPDELYTVGLFHDCGIAVLAQQFPDYKEILKQANATVDSPVTDIEDQHYDTNHTIVGYYMAKSWHLSDTITDIIQHHHSLEQMFSRNPEATMRNQMMAVLKLAGHISHTYRRLAEDYEWEIIKPQVMDHLGLDDGRLTELSEDVEALLSAQ